MRIAIESLDQLTEDEIDLGYLELETLKDIYLNLVNNYRSNYSSLCYNSYCVEVHVTLCYTLFINSRKKSMGDMRFPGGRGEQELS